MFYFWVPIIHLRLIRPPTVIRMFSFRFVPTRKSENNNIPLRSFRVDRVSHTKSSLVGSSISIPITGGRLNLGTWQGVTDWLNILEKMSRLGWPCDRTGIYLTEFRHMPHSRRVVATILFVNPIYPKDNANQWSQLLNQKSHDPIYPSEDGTCSNCGLGSGTKE